MADSCVSATSRLSVCVRVGESAESDDDDDDVVSKIQTHVAQTHACHHFLFDFVSVNVRSGHQYHRTNQNIFFVRLFSLKKNFFFTKTIFCTYRKHHHTLLRLFYIHQTSQPEENFIFCIHHKQK